MSINGNVRKDARESPLKSNKNKKSGGNVSNGIKHTASRNELVIEKLIYGEDTLITRI